jgi:hypothetical protein
MSEFFVSSYLDTSSVADKYVRHYLGSQDIFGNSCAIVDDVVDGILHGVGARGLEASEGN